MHSLYKKAGLTFIFKIIGLGIGFIFQIILGRILLPEIYGEYTLYLTYSTIFSIFSILGMDRNLIKEVAKQSDDNDSSFVLFKFSLRTSFVIFLVISAGIIVVRQVTNFSKFGIYVLIIMVLEKTLIALFDGYLQGKGYVAQVTAINTIVANILKLVFFLILQFSHVDGIVAAALSFMLSEFILIVYRILRIHSENKYKDFNNRKISTNEKREFLKYSLTVAFLSGIGILLQSIDKIIIASYLSAFYVGIYKVSQNYISLLSVFITPFVAFWPLISKLFHENKIQELEIEMRNIISIITYLTIPMFFIFMFFSEDLLLIFGTSYLTNESINVLRILAVSFLIDALSGPIGAVLTMTNYAKISLYNNIICLSINVFLSILLVKPFGIIGVSIATGASIIVNNLISIIEVRRLLKIFSYSMAHFLRVLLLVVINYVLIVILKKYIFISNPVFNLMVITVSLYILNSIFHLLTNFQFIIKFFHGAREAYFESR